MIKAGAQRWAAEAGIALVFPDTCRAATGSRTMPTSRWGRRGST